MIYWVAAGYNLVPINKTFCKSIYTLRLSTHKSSPQIALFLSRLRLLIVMYVTGSRRLILHPLRRMRLLNDHFERYSVIKGGESDYFPSYPVLTRLPLQDSFLSCQYNYTKQSLKSKYIYSTKSALLSPLRMKADRSLVPSLGLYRPGGGWFIICACCSWNLCPIRSLPAINFLTHRDTQPVSRCIRDFVVKSSTQDSKQWFTRFENI